MVAVVAVVCGLAAVGYGIMRITQAKAPTARVAAAPAPVAHLIPASTSSADASASVEVPQLVGLPLSEARILLEAAGLGVRVQAAPDGSEKRASVTTQTPSAGTVVARGESVAVSASEGGQASPVVMAGQTPVDDGLVVVIDPGHQQHSDTKPEPIGPGSHKTKAGVSGGTTGITTKLPEYEVVLQISMNLKERLEAAGVRVVMTRTTNDVHLTNSQRAKIANKAKADLFVRVHCDGSPDAKTAGATTLYPAKNKWTKPVVARSKSAAEVIQAHLVQASGAVDRGVAPRSDLTGFNYSKVPVVLVEAGFMSNPVEDKLLSSPHYQDKVAEGLAQGIMAYLSGAVAVGAGQ